MNETGSKEQQAPKLNKELNKNIKVIQETLGNPSDLMIREFKCHNNDNISCAVIGMDGLVDSNQAEDFIIKIMMVDMPLLEAQSESKQEETTFNLLYQFRVSMIDTKIGQNFDDLYKNLLSGHIIVLVDGEQQLLMMDCKGYMIRSTGEPTTDNSIRGPKESFVENLRSNTAMLRRRIKDPRLRFDSYIVGEVTQTDVAIAYIDGIVNPEFVKTAKERIQNVKIDGICDSSQLLMLIEDKFTTFFPRLLSNERPDKITADLLEGRVAIIVDGSPFVIIGPASFNMLFQAVDDYYSRPVIASFQRLIRYLAFIIVILTPALYIALSTYHQEMIPTVLLLTIINQRSANPFPTLIETLIIVILFEILREAAVRKPKGIGDSMTIVGSLIIGQTIVQAGLVSYIVVIIGALTAVCTFVISGSRLYNSARILSLIFIVVGASFGLFGIMVGCLLLILHLCSLTSFNQAYMAPVAPFNLHDQEDQFVIFPLSWMKKRPKMLNPQNVIREIDKNQLQEEQQ